MARPAAEPKPSTSRTAAIAAVLFLAVLAVVAVWWVWPKSTQEPETVALAKSLLDNGGKPEARTNTQQGIGDLHANPLIIRPAHVEGIGQ
jgi:hypothetical protein